MEEWKSSASLSARQGSESASKYSILSICYNELPRCYNELPWTRGLRHRHLLLTVLEAGSSRSSPQIWCLVRNCFLVCSLLIVSSHGREQKESDPKSLPLSTRALIPFMRVPSSWPNHLPKSPPPNTITLEIGDLSFNKWTWSWGTQTFSP